MRWVVDSQKNSLRMAREVEETLHKETEVALEAAKTLKELEAEFAKELKLDTAGDATATLRELEAEAFMELKLATATGAGDATANIATATTTIAAPADETSGQQRLRR